MSDKIEQIFNLLEKVYIDVQEVKERVSRVEQSQVRTEERVSSIEERVSSVEQSQVRMEERVSGIEQSQVRTEERVSRVEQSQVRTEERVSSIEERVSNVEQSQVRMENKFDEKLKALFDAYSLNNERISNLVNLPDRVSYLETDVRILKKIVLNQKNY